MSFIISVSSCVYHTISSNYSIYPVHTSGLEFYITNSHTCFVIASDQVTEMILFVVSDQARDVIILCADARTVKVRLFCLFAEQVDVKITLLLCTPLSKIELVGLCAITDQQHIRIQTEQIHCAPHTESSLIVQALVSGHAKFHYQGMIRIEKGAAGSYALQNNKNILLSSTASAIAVPNIEVLHHEVQCYHGAATGKFDEEQMQYMQCRGLEGDIIKQLLLQAFCAQLLCGYEKRELILQTVYEKI